MQNQPTCTYALSVEDTCRCMNCVERRNLNASARASAKSMPEPKPMKEQLESIHDEHQKQFDISVNAALQRGFGRWFDDTWLSARAQGAHPNPFISSMFVFITGVLMRKFVGGFHPDMPMDHKEQAVMDAVKMLKGYLDQIEAAGIKGLHNPQPEAPPEPPKQTIILPKKKPLRH